MSEYIITERIKEEVNRLRRMKKEIGTLLLLLILFLCFGIFIFRENHSAAYIAGFAALMLEVLFILPARSRRKRRIISSSCLYGIGAVISDCSYLRKQSMAGDILRRRGLSAGLHWTEGAVSRHVLSGSYGGSKISLCECSVGYQWGKARGELDFISGTLFTADTEATEGELVCLSRELPHVQQWKEDFTRSGYSVGSFRSRSLNDAYILLVKETSVPAWLEQSMKRLAKDKGASMLLNVGSEGLSVFLQNRFYTGRQAALADISEAHLSFCRLPERDALLEIVDKHRQRTV